MGEVACPVEEWFSPLKKRIAGLTIMIQEMVNVSLNVTTVNENDAIC